MLGIEHTAYPLMAGGHPVKVVIEHNIVEESKWGGGVNTGGS